VLASSNELTPWGADLAHAPCLRRFAQLLLLLPLLTSELA